MQSNVYPWLKMKGVWQSDESAVERGTTEKKVGLRVGVGEWRSPHATEKLFKKFNGKIFKKWGFTQTWQILIFLYRTLSSYQICKKNHTQFASLGCKLHKWHYREGTNLLKIYWKFHRSESFPRFLSQGVSKNEGLNKWIG